ncbi:MAG TPA: glycosyltransferase [Thermodesulfobacteriota bacterium]
MCTRDRARLLARALRAMRALEEPGVPYEIVVVDNGSRDRTARVVGAAAAGSAVPIRYLYEPRGGLSVVRNVGVANARGEWIAFTDDDIIVAPGWLAALRRGASTRGADFLGGRVLPRWGAPPPPWLPRGRARGEIWGALALLDYGDRDVPLAVPLGANMAVRREAIRAVGPFREDLGRDAGSLKSQAVPELMLRLRAAGAKGWYIADARVYHWIPPDRLTKRYFQRWFFWKGVSRAVMERHAPIDEAGIDFRTVPRIGRIPRYMFRQVAEAGLACVARAIRGDLSGVLVAETRLCYLAGYARAVWFGDPSPTGRTRNRGARGLT